VIKPLLDLTVEINPDEATQQSIMIGLRAYNDSKAPSSNMLPLWIIGRDGNGTVQAGLNGQTFFNWMFVQWLWVAEPFRLQKVGSELLLKAEEIARERQCIGSYLDTFTFQAQGFYERHGYKEFGRLNNIPPGHARIWLSKLF
jgi:GNAT superfamily N-acetyltransferase